MALLLGLVMLTAISLLALVATSSMILQQRMAGNFSDSQSARQAAAWAVAQGEAYLFGVGQDQRAGGCTARCFLPPANGVIRQPEDLPPFPEQQDLGWWTSWARSAVEVTGVTSTNETPVGHWSFGAEAPRYLISETHFRLAGEIAPPTEAPAIDGIAYYKILGIGFGRNASLQAVDEAIVARPWLGGNASGSEPESGQDYCAAYRAWYHCGRMSWRQLK